MHWWIVISTIFIIFLINLLDEQYGAQKYCNYDHLQKELDLWLTILTLCGVKVLQLWSYVKRITM